jgi:hypothetical protein
MGCGGTDRFFEPRVGWDLDLERLVNDLLEIRPTDVSLALASALALISSMPGVSPYDVADARELPHRTGSNVIVSNLCGDNRANRLVSPEAVAPGDTVGHD